MRNLSTTYTVSQTRSGAFLVLCEHIVIGAPTGRAVEVDALGEYATREDADREALRLSSCLYDNRTIHPLTGDDIESALAGRRLDAGGL